MAWYEDVFNEDYDRIYMHTFTEERNREEADFIESTLSVSPGSELLDLACGHGRHALLLSKRHYPVTGVDISRRFIQMAQAEAARQGLPAAFEVQDMRRLSFRDRFHGAYCYSTSFGYFPHAENIKVLEGVTQALKPGGRFLLDTLNREWELQQIEAQPRRWEQIESNYYHLDDASFNARTSRIHSHRIVLDASTRRDYDIDLRLYSLSEVEDLLESSGMKIISTYGGRDGSPFSVSSHRMVIVSEKP
jgi:SAM-dependent methyltransferase